MATTTARRHQSHPISYYWNVVKDMDDSQKLELITLLAKSVKPAMTMPPMKCYTMEDINAMIAQSEAEIAAGIGTTHEELKREWEEELEREEQEEHAMVEAI